MDETWIVFLAGTILSFALMMMLYFRIVLARGAKRGSVRRDSRRSPANRHFLDFLREEAIARVNDNLASVVAQQGRVTGAHAKREVEESVAARLSESRRTLQSLFSSEVVAAYDKVVAALDGRQPAASDALRLVTEFKEKMAGYLEKRPALSGEALTSS